jgi:hypothetical protein
MKEKRKAILISSTIAVALLLLALFFMTSPVLIRWEDRTAVDPADGLTVIFNPMRNRQPERVAAAVLGLLKDGKCEEVVSDTPIDQEYREYICGKEQMHPLTDWTLVDRTDSSEGSLLHYKAYRADYPPELYGNIWINVVKQGDSWKLTRYEAWY